MSSFLQVRILVNTDADPEPEVRLTPIDIAIPDSVGQALSSTISIANLGNSNGLGRAGAGIFESKTYVKIPLPFFGRWFKISVPITVQVEVVEKPLKLK